MCTLSWWRKDQAYGVFFNRDESIRRSAALPPAILEQDGWSCICPIDPEGGGTWAWVNMAGLIGCILNNYDCSDPAAKGDRVSRGLLLKSLFPGSSIAAIESRLAVMNGARYRGFHLFLFDGQNVLLYSWDGTEMRKTSAEQITRPLTTSGFRPREVVSFREDLWRQSIQWGALGAQDCCNDVERIERFHCCHHPDFPAYSPLMQRADARTVSQSRIRVDAQQISFAYAEVNNLQLGPLLVTSAAREP